MGIRDFFRSRRYKKAMSEQALKDLYSAFLIHHGYSKETATTEANRRIKSHKESERIRKQKAKEARKRKK